MNSSTLTFNSVSGGQSSAYLAATVPADYNIFSLVRIEDKNCLFPDPHLRKLVEDRLQLPFIATVEDDIIVRTIFDLEQFIGKQIIWVSGVTFEEVISKGGGYLPNRLHRFCTSLLKIKPIFEFWQSLNIDPVNMNIGFRGDEKRRVDKSLLACNSFGLKEFKHTSGQVLNGTNKGKNKWVSTPYCFPRFPLFSSSIFRDTIVKFWQDKPVTFAPHNNCIGCFHRNPLLLKLMSLNFPSKFDWFITQENLKKAKYSKSCWRNDVSYQSIKSFNPQAALSLDDFTDCDSGYCGL